MPGDSPVAGKPINDIEGQNGLRVIAIMRGSHDLRMGPARDIEITPGSILGLLGAPGDAAFICREKRARTARPSRNLRRSQLAPTKAGIAEVVIPARCRR